MKTLITHSLTTQSLCAEWKNSLYNTGDQLLIRDEKHCEVKGERELLIAVLYQALKDASTLIERGTRSKLRKQALEWIFDLSVIPFSFNWTCRHLKLDAEKFRDIFRTGNEQYLSRIRWSRICKVMDDDVT